MKQEQTIVGGVRVFALAGAVVFSAILVAGYAHQPDRHTETQPAQSGQLLVLHRCVTTLSATPRKYTKEGTTPRDKQFDLFLLKVEHGAQHVDAHELYRVELAGLRKGDLVVLDGQVEATNDLFRVLTDAEKGTTFNDCGDPANCLFAVGFAVNHPDDRIGVSASTNVTRAVHHCPLRVGACYEVPNDGTYTFLLMAHAALDDNIPCNRWPHLCIEPKHGEIRALVFR